MTVYTQRPKTFKEVAKQSSALEQFGLLLREWIHEVTRGDISNRPALKKTIEQPPQKLKNRFDKGVIADAYLCSYAEWIADQAGIERPAWVQRKDAQLQSPWFSDNARASLLIETPASFRQRGGLLFPSLSFDYAEAGHGSALSKKVRKLDFAISAIVRKSVRNLKSSSA